MKDDKTPMSFRIDVTRDNDTLSSTAIAAEHRLTESVSNESALPSSNRDLCGFTN